MYLKEKHMSIAMLNLKTNPYHYEQRLTACNVCMCVTYGIVLSAINDMTMEEYYQEVNGG